MQKRAVVQKKDLLIIGAILLIALGAIFLFNKKDKGTGLYVEVYSGNRVTMEVSMDKPQIFHPDGHPEITLEITEDHRVGFVESNCPDQICVHSGFLDTPTQGTACLPNNVVIMVNSTTEK